MSEANDYLNSVLENAGVSKTIYAYVMPETEQALNKIFGDAASSLRGRFHEDYREAWTQKQDSMHEEFFATWKKWSAPIVSANWDEFPFMYPTSGASEGLREAINAYGVRSRLENFEPSIHVFIGEYEGFKAYAESAGIKVTEHNRKNWEQALDKIGPNDQFYISQPSAIDGNVWQDFDEFARKLYEKQPAAELMLDLTYVGNVSKAFNVKADHPNIPAVFFSLSKPMGTYYHRIGGCLSRSEYKGLFGNKWFKNLLALRLGTEMMKAHDVFELPTKYKPIQEQALKTASEALNLELKASDVYLLGTTRPSEDPSELETYLTRGSEGEAMVRVCLTPTIAKIVNPDIDNTVKARPHEELKL